MSKASPAAILPGVAPVKAARSATQNAVQSKFVSSHLCGSVQ